MNKITEIAKMIDHSILHPTLTDDDLKRECEVARKYNVASVCVKPYAVKQAVDLLKGSDVFVGCVIGFPAGNSSIAVKAFETETACKDGAVEIDMVINIGKALQEDWAYLEDEIKAVVNTSHRYGAITKVIFETDFVTKDEQKIRLCEICSKAGADYVKTSTGFGFVKGPDGKFSYKGATAHDLELMRKHSAPQVKVKAAGGVRTLTDLLRFKEIGISRCGATATASMLEEARKFFGEGEK
ncbi:MAG: deoxyribose-phosphate aldolase [Bacteroidetes bacterium RBG_13_42_15]|nr:MAG: deoxyribose-phosphate aldolase [Bacteroidetes bacterium RBG_13_42_15]